jgi:hypothetical protein
MKTLTIKQKCESSIEHSKKAAEHIRIARVRRLRFKLFSLINIALLFITISNSAQSFNPAKYFNKTSTEILTVASDFMRYSVGEYKGNLCINRFSSDYGLVSFVFNKDNLCNMILLPTVSKRTFTFSEYKMIESGNNITEITQ